MGDRAQVKFVDNDGKEIWFYSHWGGYHIQTDVKNAIVRGKDRWEDEEYFARIIFSEMIKNNVLENTGFGIGFSKHGDLQHPVVIVDCKKQSVSFNEGYSWEMFANIKP